MSRELPPPETRWSADDERLIDLLVDGELDEARRRELLTRFEEQPEGWRRCALAFLQSQCFGESARDVKAALVGGAASAEAEPVMVASRAPQSTPRWVGPVATLSTMAASFLIAFSLGAWWQGWSLTMPGAAPQVEQVAASEPNTVRSDAADSSPSDGKLADDISLVVDNGKDGPLAGVQVPMVETQRLEDAWSRPWAEKLPKNALELLEQAAREPQRPRQYLQLQLEDGRRLIVPVDELRLQPAEKGR